jgi:hypothetical protein
MREQKDTRPKMDALTAPTSNTFDCRRELTSLTVRWKTRCSGNRQQERRDNRYSDTALYRIGYFRHTRFSAIQGGVLEMRADELIRRLISGKLTNYSVVRTSLEPLHV